MKPKFKFSNEPYYRCDEAFWGRYKVSTPKDAERELTATLSEQIAAEIDRQILEFLRNYNYETKI